MNNKSKKKKKKRRIKDHSTIKVQLLFREQTEHELNQTLLLLQTQCLHTLSPFITSFIPQFLPRHYNPSRSSAPPHLPPLLLPSLSSCIQLAYRRRALWLTLRGSRGGGEPDSLALSCGVWSSRSGAARHFWPYISTMWTGVRGLPTALRPEALEGFLYIRPCPGESFDQLKYQHTVLNNIQNSS